METSQTENSQIPLILIHGAWLSARSWQFVKLRWVSCKRSHDPGGSAPPSHRPRARC